MIELFAVVENTILGLAQQLARGGGFVEALVAFGVHYVAILVTLVFLGVLLVHREPYERFAKLLFSICAVALACVLYVVLSTFVIRVSPAEVLGFEPLLAGSGGFPALAPLWVTTLAMVSGMILSHRLMIWFFVGGIVTAIAQVVAGLHWPYDVAAGLLIGILAPLLVRRFFPQMEAARVK